MPYRSLQVLRAALLRRLGFGAAGPNAGIIAPTIDSFLAEAQYSLYWEHDWAELQVWEDKDIGVNQYLVDYPSTMITDKRVQRIMVNLGTSTTPNWRALTRGIREQDYNQLENTSWPLRYQRKAQIELSPKSNAIYTLRMFGVKDLLPFANDADVATVDDHLVFNLALVEAKSHYKQADAQIQADKYSRMLERVKSEKGWSKNVFPATREEMSDPRYRDIYDGSVPLVTT